MNLYAFVLIHFGSNVKYLEYELYTLLMLNKFSNMDIVYMYSINDTPEHFLTIINNLKKHFNIINLKLIPYDDLNSTFGNNINYKSSYEHFNLLRTANFLFALQLIQYKRVCLIESDMIFLKNLDDIFKLKQPSVLFYHSIHFKFSHLNQKIKIIINNPTYHNKHVNTTSTIDSIYFSHVFVFPCLRNNTNTNI